VSEIDSKKLRDLVEAALPELDTVIGWGEGYDALHATPVFARGAEGLDKLVWSPFCVQNLSGYLVKTPAVEPEEKGKKIGVFVKGCDSRSVVALLQEKFITRDRLYIIGVPCKGVVDWRRVMRKKSLFGVKASRVEGEHLVVEHSGGVEKLELKEILARKCLRCLHPNPVIYDVLAGDPVSPRVEAKTAYRDVEELDLLSLEERLSFWQTELERCMRCNACRNACPLCVCQDRCIAETRDPGWLTQRMGISEKYLFHFIHALHLAGRCTECGECERVCPMEIPVTLIKEKLNLIVRDLLSYEAGIDPEAVPALLTYNPNETGI
jgi:ferredoxin